MPCARPGCAAAAAAVLCDGCSMAFCTANCKAVTDAHEELCRVRPAAELVDLDRGAVRPDISPVATRVLAESLAFAAAVLGRVGEVAKNTSWKAGQAAAVLLHARGQTVTAVLPTSGGKTLICLVASWALWKFGTSPALTKARQLGRKPVTFIFEPVKSLAQDRWNECRAAGSGKYKVGNASVLLLSAENWSSEWNLLLKSTSNHNIGECVTSPLCELRLKLPSAVFTSAEVLVKLKPGHWKALEKTHFVLDLFIDEAHKIPAWWVR